MNNAVLFAGAGIFPIVGGALATFGWNVPYLAYLLRLPLALYAVRHLEEPAHERDSQGLAYLRRAASVRRARCARLLRCGGMTQLLLFGTVLTILPFLLAGDFGMSAFAIGLLLSVAGFVGHRLRKKRFVRPLHVEHGLDRRRVRLLRRRPVRRVVGTLAGFHRRDDARPRRGSRPVDARRGRRHQPRRLHGTARRGTQPAQQHALPGTRRRTNPVRGSHRDNGVLPAVHLLQAPSSRSSSPSRSPR